MPQFFSGEISSLSNERPPMNMRSGDTHIVPLPEKLATYTDIDVAATLIAKGHKLLSSERLDDGKTGFTFLCSTEVEMIAKGYWFNEVEVHPLEFATARKNLKSRLFALQRIRY